MYNKPNKRMRNINPLIQNLNSDTSYIHGQSQLSSVLLNHLTPEKHEQIY